MVLLGVAGLAVAIHATFLLRGHEAFRLPVSLALLVATSVLSLAQAAALLAPRNPP
jgi:hypothetical protein